MGKTAIKIVMLMLCLSLTAACGKKPNKLEAPEDTRDQTEPTGKFPRSYPKPWL